MVSLSSKSEASENMPLVFISSFFPFEFISLMQWGEKLNFKRKIFAKAHPKWSKAHQKNMSQKSTYNFD